MILRKLFRSYFELAVWLFALIYLALFAQPDAIEHFSICVYRAIGFDSCWGCGLGRSVAFALQGNLAKSWEMHPLGLPAIAILLHRIYRLIRLARKA